MNLTHREKRAILEGTLKTLVRDAKPNLTDGQEFTLAISRPHAYTDPETRHVFRPPPERVAWITITNTVRRARGGWAIRFHLTDNRQPHYYLGKGGGYTTDFRDSIDRLEVRIDEKTQARLTAEARQVNAERREKVEELADRDRRRQERAFRDRLREALSTLDSPGQVALLAGMERLLQEHGADAEAA